MRCYFFVIDLVLIDQQSVGNRRLHLMDTVNAEKEINDHLLTGQQFLTESHIVTSLVMSEHHFRT
jgi:hypothetical protein